MTRFAEVVGDPIAQSLSPVIHGFWLEALGMAAEYRREQVDRAGFSSWLDRRRGDPDWLGANVTMPLKLDALSAADELSDRAVAAGAANLLKLQDGKLYAANTDVGAVAALVARLKDGGAPADRVTILGNGGAARAALVGLRFAGVHDIVIQARDMAAARALAVEFQTGHAPQPLTARIEGDGLINCTPLGMEGEDCLNCELGGLNPEGWVFDMVTGETPLLTEAARRGLKLVRGIDMLVEQAATSFEIFFGAQPPRDRDGELMLLLRP